MKRSVTAYINENRELITNQSEGFSGENNAEILEISLGPFAEMGFDYYVVNYSTGVIGGESSSDVIATENDSPAYVSEGVIYFPLELRHTSTGRFRFQIDAFKNTDGKDTLVKTSIASLTFKPSLSGGDFTGGSSLLLSKIIKLEETIAQLRETVENDINESGNRLQSDISELEGKHHADLKLVTDKFAEIVSDHKTDVERLEVEIEESRNIPVASDKTVGGIKISPVNDIQFDEENCLAFDYVRADQKALTVIVTATLMESEAEAPALIFYDPEDGAGAIESLNEQIMMLESGYCVYGFINGGKYTYYDMSFNEIEVNAVNRSLHIMKIHNGEITVEQYYGKTLRKLLTEGVKFE